MRLGDCGGLATPQGGADSASERIRVQRGLWGSSIALVEYWMRFVIGAIAAGARPEAGEPEAPAQRPAVVRRTRPLGRQ